MTNLTESNNFDAGVYEWQTTDPVLGGANGVAVQPIQNLTNRTRWLYGQVESILANLGVVATDIAALSAGAFSAGMPGYVKFSNGFVLQWISQVIPGDGAQHNYLLPYTFPTGPIASVVAYQAAVPPVTGAVGSQPNGTSAVIITNTANGGNGNGVYCFVIGY